MIAVTAVLTTVRLAAADAHEDSYVDPKAVARSAPTGSAGWPSVIAWPAKS